jgi:hypothetical protein
MREIGLQRGHQSSKLGRINSGKANEEYWI